MNRLSCLRLTERCADILMCIREEIYDAGDYVGQELYAPITKLVESVSFTGFYFGERCLNLSFRLYRAFAEVHQLLQKHINRPFLKRYLKRNDIMRDIQNCDVELTNALGMFSVSCISQSAVLGDLLNGVILGFDSDPYPSTDSRLG